MNDKITELLDRIGELSGEELDELESSVLSDFESVEGQDPTRETVDQMTGLADAAEAVRGEKAKRATEAAQLASERDAATARVRGQAEAQAKDPNDDSDEGVAPADGDVASPDGPDAVVEVDSSALPADTDETGPNEAATPTPDEDGVKKAKSAPSGTYSTEAPAESTASAETATTETAAPAAAEAAVVEAPAATESAPAPAAEASVQEAAVEETAVTEASTEVPAEAEASVDEASVAGEDSEAIVTAAAEPGAVEVPAEFQPKAAVRASVAITAGADIPGITAGSTLPDMQAVAEALIKRRSAMGRTSGGDGEQHTVATLKASFPEDRILTETDLAGNSRKINAVVDPSAITAGGGICAPVEVSYDIFGLGELGRPVRDALAVFSADRGGIRFVTPPNLTFLNGSVSLWTLQNDIDSSTPGAPDPVKPCLRVNCGVETVVYTDAIPLCLTFGNMGARAYPELVARHTELGMIWHARYAEQRLLTRIGALSTQVSAGRTLGVARDFFVQLEKAAAGYRNRHRMLNDAPLRVILPGWFLNALRADLVQQMPGDGADETFALADSFVNSWFSARHINQTWSMDGEDGQILGAQAAGALNDFPSTVIWYLFAEGTFLFLDGGTLDLGLVRDSTLNGTNDYKIFLETFEGVAMVGVEALRITTTFKANGAATGLVSPS